MSFDALTDWGTRTQEQAKDHRDESGGACSTGSFDNDKDYFIEVDGQKFAGLHLLVDLWGASHLNDLKHIEKALCDAAMAAGATILHCHLHHFTPNGGISGVLVLAESHISIHTWPERDFAALDIFMCGDCDPHDTLPVLEAAFKPAEMLIGEERRGIVK
ncbi:adenosylmethionine decarboxylase [Magnetospira sp. QH-2]|uniref:adenosylmethionine decarboxylase n=1 Tax=Magnetospira sp. (strain QH-2) TaxID=1288970 RepID=UPI0003E81A1E|nr:adenosylmethionine decarboxylase [Magnetospira sp. QH-2]CCQ74115.1 S-adenosylmethionine decarboxylase proenzyme (modular protein) [Magnetospira sp. QH-2]